MLYNGTGWFPLLEFPAASGIPLPPPDYLFLDPGLWGTRKAAPFLEGTMSGIQGTPFRVILLAAAILSLLATPTFSADRKTLRKQAEAGDAKSQHALGEAYYFGRGVTRDFAEALKWYRMAGDHGYAAAHNNIGQMYMKGEGVPRDPAEAVKWYRKAAEMGDAPAQSNLGVAYFKGRGVPRNYAEAVKWTRKAAEQGLTIAQFNLGVAYFKGQGVPRDPVQAYFFLSMAASGSAGEDRKKFSRSRDLAASKLTPENLMEAQKMTREWKAKHPGK